MFHAEQFYKGDIMNGITKIWLFAGVPVDPTKRNFRLANNQTDYFNFCFQYTKWNGTEYTYQRESQELYIEADTESIKNCNYLCYINNAKYYFCFISRIEYENENCSRIQFEVDNFSTWFYNLKVKPCFVEREHVSDDTVGLHTVDEGLQGEYTITAVNEKKCGELLVFGAFTEEAEALKGNFLPPQVYGGFPQAVYFFGFGALSALNTSMIKNVIDIYASEGKSSAIIGFFTVPRDFASSTQEIKTQTWNVSNGQLTGNVKNNKLKCYPFTSLQVQAGGSLTVFKYEDFSGTPIFELSAGFGENMCVMMMPKQYQGVTYNLNHVLTLSGFPTLNWLSNNFQNYQAQKNAELSTQTYINVGQAVTSAAVGAAMGSFVPGAGTAVGAAAGAATSIVSQLLPSTLATVSELFRSQVSSSFICSSLNGSAAAADIMSVSNSLGFYAYCKTLKQEYLKMFDDYFTMYGYKVNALKIPELNSRKSWNFLKTHGFSCVGDAPADAIQEIKNIFDNGVTLWHTNDIYNYNLDNGIL